MVQAKVDIYEIITERMIQRIEAEKILPWHKPWKNYLSHSGQPQNLVSKKPYRGCNVWILESMGYSSPFWLSYKQAEQLKGHVRKGEKGTPVVFWHWFDKKGLVGDKKERVPVLRYFTVWNVEQCDGIEVPKLEEKPSNDVGSLEACDLVIEAMQNKPKITFNEAQAYYSPSHDRVNMPRKESFEALPGFYATFFHELVHSTGHASRCARMKTNNDWHRFGSDRYAKEELVAEMGSAFLCGITGIQPEIEDNSVAYLQGWISRLKEDKKLLVSAAGQAQKAADYILNVKFETEKEG